MESSLQLLLLFLISAARTSSGARKNHESIASMNEKVGKLNETLVNETEKSGSSKIHSGTGFRKLTGRKLTRADLCETYKSVQNGPPNPGAILHDCTSTFGNLGDVTGLFYMAHDLPGYGCYCGSGQKGRNKEPIDNTDGCCQKHDQCWHRVHNGNGSCVGVEVAHPLCPYQYLVNSDLTCTSYKYSCEERTTNRSQTLKCEHDEPCPYAVCQCDMEFAQCIEKYHTVGETKPCHANHLLKYLWVGVGAIFFTLRC